ncbi:MAG: hypothetical protein ACRDO8_02680, partial [Nocardioidaceae bacterium]
MQHVRDRLVRSDPGLARLRMAVAGASAMASALAVEAAFAGLIGAGRQGTLIAMLLGAVVSMMGSMALTGTRVWGKVRTAAFFPVAVGVGLVAGVSVSGHTRTMLVMFVALMFVAVFVRRFGIDFFFYGFMMWIGFFFTSLLRATAEQLPLLLGATVVASVWVLVLSATVLRTHPGRTLARVRRAFGARARALADACAELLETDAAAARELERRRRRLHGAHARLAETALMIEAWSAEEGALPPGSSAAALRRRILDLQLALDRVAVAAERLAGSDSALRPGAERVCRLMSRRRYAGVRKAARNLHLATEQDEGTGAEERRAARHLAAAADDFVTSVPPTDSSPVPDEDPFEPAVTLALGNLPGSPAVAQDVAPRGWRWNPVRRMDFTTRQAVQVTLAGVIAVVLGRELDSTRYYWAVITAFIAFTGTGTRSEAFLKAFNR